MFVSLFVCSQNSLLQGRKVVEVRRQPEKSPAGPTYSLIAPLSAITKSPSLSDGALANEFPLFSLNAAGALSKSKRIKAYQYNYFIIISLILIPKNIKEKRGREDERTHSLFSLGKKMDS